MRRRNIGQYVLSPRIPESVKQTKLALCDLCGSLSEFADEYLRGALTFTDECGDDGYVTICSYQCSYALRVAVEYGSANRPVEVTARAADGKFYLHIFIKENVELEALAEIARALRRAGFSVIPYSYGIRAETDLDHHKLLKIYAKSRRTFLQDLHTVFFV